MIYGDSKQGCEFVVPNEAMLSLLLTKYFMPLL